MTVNHCALGNPDTNSNSYLWVPTVGSDVFETRGSLKTNFENEYILERKVTRVHKIDVTVKKLDDFRIEHVGFMKIDVEGFEPEVLQGAKETIKNSKPNIFIEIEQRYHKQSNVVDIFNYIVDLGYVGYFTFRKKLRRIADFDANIMQNPENEKCKGLYVSNFIFTPYEISCLKL